MNDAIKSLGIMAERFEYQATYPELREHERERLLEQALHYRAEQRRAGMIETTTIALVKKHPRYRAITITTYAIIAGAIGLLAWLMLANPMK